MVFQPFKYSEPILKGLGLASFYNSIIVSLKGTTKIPKNSKASRGAMIINYLFINKLALFPNPNFIGEGNFWMSTE